MDMDMDPTTPPSWSSSSEGIGLVKSKEEKKAHNNRVVEKPEALNCPRCNSSNTKFCYYNNYNLSQPRYFCKTCRRYWTAGGTLRNVPVGGASRKINKRSSKTSNHLDHHIIMPPQPPPPSLTNMVLHSPNADQHIVNNGDQDEQLLIGGGFLKNRNNDDYAKGMMNSFMPSNSNNMMMTMMMNNGFENDQHNTTTTAPSTSARMFFPLDDDDLKPTPTSENEGDSDCNAYWSGGGGSPW